MYNQTNTIVVSWDEKVPMTLPKANKNVDWHPIDFNLVALELSRRCLNPTTTRACTHSIVSFVEESSATDFTMKASDFDSRRKIGIIVAHDPWQIWCALTSTWTKPQRAPRFLCRMFVNELSRRFNPVSRSSSETISNSLDSTQCTKPQRPARFAPAAVDLCKDDPKLVCSRVHRYRGRH